MKAPTPLVYVDVSKTITPDFSVERLAAWLAREPVHDNPFPDWMAASVILPQAIRYLSRITSDAIPIRTPAGAVIGSELGLGFVGFEIACAFVPSEDRDEFQYLLDTALAAYCPDTRKLEGLANGLKAGAESLALINTVIAEHVSELLANGAPPIHDYIARLTGLGLSLPPMGDKE